MLNVPTFSDPKLQEVANRVAPTLNGWQQKVDNISRDILALEKWLRTAPLCIPVEHEGLHWGQDEHNNWRIIYKDRTLVEAPALLRMEAAPLLGEFLDKCKEVING